MKDNNSCAFRTSIGGQALIEGILMRGPKKQAIVCRTAEGLVEKTEDEDKAQKLIIGVAVVMGIALSLFLFIFLPAFLVGLIKPLANRLVLRNLTEGAVRVAILLIYMKAVTYVSDVKRLFSYHGAEHKTIFCYEHGKALTVENVREESRFHPRCGTSFLLVVVVVSILVNSVVRLKNSFARMGCHLLLLPLVVGISYEINRWCGKHDNALSAFLSSAPSALSSWSFRKKRAATPGGIKKR